MVGTADSTVSPSSFEDQPQHAMRAGVLRPHVDGHHFGLDVGHYLTSR